MKSVIIPTRLRIVSAEETNALNARVTVYPQEHARLSLSSLPRPGCACSACDLASRVRRAEQDDSPVRGACGDPLGDDCDCPQCQPFKWPAFLRPQAQ